MKVPEADCFMWIRYIGHCRAEVVIFGGYHNLTDTPNLKETLHWHALVTDFSERSVTFVFVSNAKGVYFCN